MSTSPEKTPTDAWSQLRQHTVARIGLPRSGASLATTALLHFKLAHARARDAVHAPLDEGKLVADLRQLGQPVLVVSSAARDRQQYLMRPDLGRRLSDDARGTLRTHVGAPCNAAFVIADGLSSRAAQDHAPALLAHVLPEFTAQKWTIAPLVVARHGRVALGDVIASALHASIAVVLIGERPGLSAPDSMGAYLTWQPNANTSDADRNCISNIRPEGLGYADAAFTLTHLLQAMRTQRLSGVRLKDDTHRLLIER